MPQVEGLMGRAVEKMIERSVRARFHTVFWRKEDFEFQKPVIFVPNHHGWHDGYLMFHLIRNLQIECLDWITEFDAFPLFAKVGGMPFPADDPARRATTVRTTIRRMNEERKSLILFAESDLHRPPEILPLGKALETVLKHVPGSQVVPVAIVYQMSLHERPEAALSVGAPVPDPNRESVREALETLHRRTAHHMQNPEQHFEVLVKGTLDVNERWDVRRRFGKK